MESVVPRRPPKPHTPSQRLKPPAQSKQASALSGFSSSSRLASELKEALGRVGQTSGDLEDRFVALLREYKEKYNCLEEIHKSFGGNPAENDSVAAPAPFPEPPADPAATADAFRWWRRSFVEEEVNFEKRLPRLRLKAEGFRQEVEDALTKADGADSVQSFVRLSYIERFGRLRCQRNMALGRLRCAHDSGIYQQEGATSYPAASLTTRAHLRLIDKEIDIAKQRLPKLREGADSMNALVGSATVTLRQQLSEDTSTKTLRYFFRKLQYCVVSHRARIWRKSLELRAISEMGPRNLSPGESNVAPVPLGVVSRRAAEKAAQDLGQLYGCTASPQADKGKTFYHQVAVAFPAAFHEQEQRLKLKPYCVGEDAVAGASPIAADAPGGIAAGVATSSASSVGPVHDGDALYLRPSRWAKHMPWRARIDPSVVEQGVLLRASYAAGISPTRIEHEKPSYARSMVENVVSCNKAAEGNFEWDADVDSILRAERAFLEVSDMKKVAHRLNDVAEKHCPDSDLAQASVDRKDGLGAVGSAASALMGTSVDDKHTLPQPVLKGYYMLRHLECRAKRQKLLSFLNFCRFLQRRLVIGLGEGASSSEMPPSPGGLDANVERAWGRMQSSANASSTAIGEDALGLPNPSGGGLGGTRGMQGSDTFERYWDYSPRTLARMCQQVSVQAVDGGDFELPGNEHEGADGDFPTDREKILRLDDSDFIATDESGKRIMHAAALDDLASLEREMLSIGSYYIHKHEASTKEETERPRVDRIGVLYDLYAAEVWFCSQKTKLLEAYLEIYEHTTNPMEKWDLSQRIIDVMAIRPRLDLEDDYFTDAYAVTICLLESRANLMRSLLAHQIRCEREMVFESVHNSSVPPPSPPPMTPASQVERERTAPRRNSTSKMSRTSTASQQGRETGRETARETGREFGRDTGRSFASGVRDEDGDSAHSDDDEQLANCCHASEGHGSSSYANKATHIKLTPSANQVAIDEFFSTTSLCWKAELVLEDVLRDLCECFHPTSPIMVTFLERSCYVFAMDQWKLAEESDLKSARQPRKRGLYEDSDALLAAFREVSLQIATGGTVAANRSGSADRDSTPDGGKDTPQRQESEFGIVEVDGFMHMSFADVRRRSSGNAKEIYCQMVLNLLEHVLLRRAMAETAIEVQYVEKTVMFQGIVFNHKMDTKRPTAVHDSRQKVFENAAMDNRGDSSVGNAWIDSSTPQLSAGFLNGHMGSLDLSSLYLMVLQCSTARLQELRVVYQHELAWRNLVVVCVQYNAMLLDPQVRQKETTDAALVGPGRDILGDMGPLVARKLGETVELSGPVKEARRKNTGKSGDLQTFMDMSRYTQHLQNPFVLVQPVLAAVNKHFEQKMEELDISQMVGGVEKERLMRDLWSRSLPCSSLCISRIACDVSIRVQATRAGSAFRSLALLFPARLSPFVGTADKKQLVEKDGSVGSIFTVPTSLDTLLLRGIKKDPDLLATVMKIHESMEQQVGTSSSSGGKTLDGRKAASRQSTSTPARGSLGFQPDGISGMFGMGAKTPQTGLPRLEFEYDGPTMTALVFLHELATMLSLRYTLCAIDGDPVTMLRMQRYVRYSFVEMERSSLVGSTLSRTDPTFETLENLRNDLGALARRIEGLGSAPPVAGAPGEGVGTALGSGGAFPPKHDPEQVFRLLRTDTIIGHALLDLLLRGAARECLREDAIDDAAEMRRWLAYLENTMASTNLLPAPEPNRSYQAPVLASLPMLAVHRPLVGGGNIAIEEGEEPMPDSGGWGCPGNYVEAAAAAFFSTQPTADYAQLAHLLADAAPPEATAMQGDLLVRDRRRYVALFHPALSVEHPWLEALTRKLLAGYASSVPWHGAQDSSALGAISSGVAPPAPRWQSWGGLVTLSLPPAPYLRLRTAVCTVPPARQRQLSALRVQLLEKREVFAKHYLTKHNTAEIADAEREYFATNVLVDVLKDRVVRGQLMSAPLRTAGDLARFESHFDIHFPKPAALTEASEQRLNDDLAMANMQMECNYQWIAALISHLDQLLLAVVCERLGRELVGIVAIRHHETAARSARICGKRRSDRRDLTASKVDLVLRSANWLRGCSTFVQMYKHDENSERAYVFDEEDLNRCVEGLLQRVPRWGNDIIQSRESLAEQTAQYQRARLATLRQERELQMKSDTAYQARETLVKREFTNRGCQAVFEIERIHRDIKELQTVSSELEYRLSSEVWEKVRSAVAAVTGELATATGQYREGHGKRAQQVAGQMRIIRERVASDFASLASKNLASQTKAVQMRPKVPRSELSDDGVEEPTAVSQGMRQKVMEVARRDDQKLLRLQIEEFKNRLICARTFYYFKCQAMRHKYGDQLRALQMTLASNHELLARLAKASHSNAKIAADFNGTAQKMALAELQIEDKVALAETNLENRQRLQSWRRNKAKQLAHIDQKVRDHQRVGTVDVEGMVREIQEKKALVQRLRQERLEEDKAVGQAVSQCAYKTEVIREDLRQQQRMKEGARQTLEKRRAEAEMASLTDEERLQLWHSRTDHARRRFAELQEEHQQLKAIHKSLGMDT